MNKKKIIILSATACGFLLIAYAIWYSVLWSGFQRSLAEYGYKDVQASGFMPYFDGVVIGHVQLDDALSAEKLYVHNYPWQWSSNKARKFYIEKLAWKISGSTEKPIHWPFKRSDTIHIENLEVAAPLMGHTITLSGNIKKLENAPFLFDLSSQSPQFKGTIKGEVHAHHKMVNVIDLEFQEAQLKDDLIRTKRMSGWFSFSWDKKWHVMGEVESGFASSAGFQTYDNNLKINGPVDNIDFAFAANVEKTLQPVILDRNENTVAVRSFEEKNDIEWSGLNADFIAALQQVLDVQYAQNQDAEHIKMALVNAKKRSKRVLLEDEKSQAKQKPVHENKTQIVRSNDSLVVEQTILPQVTFEKLADGSFFDGFYYNRPLTVIPHACGDLASSQCWTARAQGGQLSYGIDGHIPSYFARIKDIDQARLIRKVLKDFKVQLMTIKGHGTVIDRIDLKGFDADRTPAYIELAVDDLE